MRFDTGQLLERHASEKSRFLFRLNKDIQCYHYKSNAQSIPLFSVLPLADSPYKTKGRTEYGAEWHSLVLTAYYSIDIFVNGNTNAARENCKGDECEKITFDGIEYYLADDWPLFSDQFGYSPINQEHIIDRAAHTLLTHRAAELSCISHGGELDEKKLRHFQSDSRTKDRLLNKLVYERGKCNEMLGRYFGERNYVRVAGLDDTLSDALYTGIEEEQPEQADVSGMGAGRLAAILNEVFTGMLFADALKL